MISLNVYNNNNEKIGDINELITDLSGKIDAVVIGVGGFLGMGERNVGLPWNQLKFIMEPRPANAASSSTTNDPLSERERKRPLLPPQRRPWPVIATIRIMS